MAKIVYGPQVYPWDEWMRRAVLKLRRGSDYVCDDLSIYQQVRNQATKRGLSTSHKVMKWGLMIVIKRGKKNGKAASRKGRKKSIP